MRIPLIATAAALLIVVFAPVESLAGGMVVSKFNCPQTLPCTSSDPAFPSPEALAALGNACLVKNMGISLGNGFFDTMAGVDSSGCLTQISGGSSSASSGAKCCIQQGGNGRCFMHCDLVAEQ